jgi:flavodoxin
MKYVIVYWSRYGNGKKVVDYLSEKIREKSGEIQIFKTDEINPSEMPDADIYLFSAPTEAFNVQTNMKKFMKQLRRMEEKKYGLINTHAMKRNVLHKMDKLLSKKNMVKVADVDFMVGDDAKNANGLMQGWETKIDEFAKKI